ncbi:MAG: helix-turn-helix domain-containing protein [Burkholderiales bacterium]
MDPAIAFGRVLRQLRLEAGLTQEQLGFEADLRRTYISILELGQQQPTLTSILKLANGLGRSAQEVIALVEAEIARKRPNR